MCSRVRMTIKASSPRPLRRSATSFLQQKKIYNFSFVGKNVYGILYKRVARKVNIFYDIFFFLFPANKSSFHFYNLSPVNKQMTCGKWVISQGFDSRRSMQRKINQNYFFMHFCLHHFYLFSLKLYMQIKCNMTKYMFYRHM